MPWVRGAGNCYAVKILSVTNTVVRVVRYGFSKNRIAPPARRGNLTNREIEVLSLLAEGNSTNEVSSSLQISGHTVRNHIQNVLFKLQVNNRLKAINLSRRLGMIE